MIQSALYRNVKLTKGLYGASAYGFANDPDFFDVSKSDKFWQEVIDNYYKKYYGIAAWHNKLLKTAMSEKMLQIPSGRYYPIAPNVLNGRVKWPLTIIKNYPVKCSGFGQ